MLYKEKKETFVLCEEDASHWTFVYTYTTLIESR